MSDEMAIGPDDKSRCQSCHAEKVAPCFDCDEECMKEDLATGPDNEVRCEGCHADKVKAFRASLRVASCKEKESSTC